MAIKDLMSKTKISEFPLAKGKVIEIEAGDDLHASFNVLIDNNILSAPVYNAKGKQYIGFLDIRDIVAFAVFATEEDNTAMNLSKLLSSAGRYLQKTQETVTVSYLARRNPFKPVTEDSTLLDVAKLLASGSRRVPVVNAEGRVVNIISQTSIVHWMLKAIPNDAEIMKQTVSDLGIGTSPVLSVVNTDSALNVFKKLDSTNHSGLAVVDETGALIGNTSGADLKLYVKYHASLNMPITDFLNQIRRLDLKTRSPTFTCHPHDDLNKVLGKLNATKVHRLFVVDDQHKPLKVISVSDIVRLLLK